MFKSAVSKNVLSFICEPQSEMAPHHRLLCVSSRSVRQQEWTVFIHGCPHERRIPSNATGEAAREQIHPVCCTRLLRVGSELKANRAHRLKHRESRLAPCGCHQDALASTHIGAHRPNSSNHQENSGDQRTNSWGAQRSLRWWTW